MNLDLNISAIDVEKSRQGAWCQYTPEIKFLVGREGTTEYRKSIQDIYAKNKQAIDNNTMSDKQSDLELCKIIVDFILLGWEGLTSKGEDFPYTKENAITLLSDESYFELRAWIVGQAKNMKNFRAQEIKKLVKS